MTTVYFGGNIIPEQSYVPLQLAQNSLSIDWQEYSGELYSIIFYDVDAPDPIPNAVDAPFLHYMIVDIPGKDISKGRELMPYMPPNPSSGSHVYFVEVYRQNGPLKARRRRARKNSQLRKFVKDNSLELVGSSQFFTGSSLPSASGRVGIANVSDADYYKDGYNLDEPEERYCRCVLHVGALQDKDCLEQNAAGLISGGEIVNGRACSNPYAICANSIRTTSRRCGKNYNFPKLSDNEIMAYAILSKIPIPEPYDRMTLLNNIVISKLIEDKS